MIKLSIHFDIHFHWRGLSKLKNKHFTNSRLLSEVLSRALGQLEMARSKSTMDNYRTALRSFLTYAGENVRESDFNQQLVEGYQQWLYNRGVSMNAASCYMRSLRALLTHSKEIKWDSDCFKTVFVGKTKTDKRSIPIEEIRRLHDLSLPEGSKLQFVRDMFLFCFYSLGMPFVDLSFLRKSDIKDGYITYHRHKTGQMVKVRIEPPMQCIINRYSVEHSNYVFPILTTEDRQQSYLEYEKARASYNYYLHRLSERAQLECNLTSYVVRHSWASHAYKTNVDLSVISKALGHTSTDTTLIYIREIDDKRIECANLEIIRDVEDAKP